MSAKNIVFIIQKIKEKKKIFFAKINNYECKIE